MMVPFSGGCACGALISAQPNLLFPGIVTAGIVNARVAVRFAQCFDAVNGADHHRTEQILRRQSRKRQQSKSGVLFALLVFIQAELVPDLQGLWAASLDNPSLFQPQVHVWTDRAQPWDCMTSTLAKIGEAPNAEQMQKLLTPRE